MQEHTGKQKVQKLWKSFRTHFIYYQTSIKHESKEKDFLVKNDAECLTQSFRDAAFFNEILRLRFLSIFVFRMFQ